MYALAARQRLLSDSSNLRSTLFKILLISVEQSDAPPIPIFDFARVRALRILQSIRTTRSCAVSSRQQITPNENKETEIMRSKRGSMAFLRVGATALCGLILAASVATRAEAETVTVTLNLNELPIGAFTSPVDVDGFVLTPNLNGSNTPQIESLDGLNVLGADSVSSQGADTFLTMADGDFFSVVSLSMEDDGGDLIGIFDGTDGITYGRDVSLFPTLTAYDYSSTFQNTTSIDLDPVNLGGDPVIGNITVSFTSTPEPGTLVLLGIGMTAFGLTGHRMAKR
jgi:hypothetical protein